MKQWTKVERINNWGHLQYEPELEPNKPYILRFPDGTETEAMMLKKQKSFTVTDMGHTYGGETYQYGITYDVHGIAVFLDASEFHIQTETPDQLPFGE